MGVRGRTEYELTERGEAEFGHLLRTALRRPDRHRDQLGAALAFLPSLPRDEAVALLRERLAACREAERAAAERRSGWDWPPHVRELFGLWAADAAGGAEWTRGLIERLEAGAYPMAGVAGLPRAAGQLAAAGRGAVLGRGIGSRPDGPNLSSRPASAPTAEVPMSRSGPPDTTAVPVTDHDPATDPTDPAPAVDPRLTAGASGSPPTGTRPDDDRLAALVERAAGRARAPLGGRGR